MRSSSSNSDADRARHAGPTLFAGQGHVLGPLVGIPVLLKANIDTRRQNADDRELIGTARLPGTSDSTVAAKLRASGAVILGKTNLSEKANFRPNFPTQRLVGGRRSNSTILTGSIATLVDRAPGRGCRVSQSLQNRIVRHGDGWQYRPGPANANGVVGIKPTVGFDRKPCRRGPNRPHSGHGWPVWPYHVADAAVALGGSSRA